MKSLTDPLCPGRENNPPDSPFSPKSAAHRDVNRSTPPDQRQLESGSRTNTPPARSIATSTAQEPSTLPPKITRATHKTPQELIEATQCPANPDANCVGRHGVPRRDGKGNLCPDVCPLLYRQIVDKADRGRGGTHLSTPKFHALMCAHPDATNHGVLGVLAHHNTPKAMRHDIPLKPALSREVLDAVARATGDDQ